MARDIGSADCSHVDARPGRVPRSALGFTLIELMIVVSIIAMLTAIAYPAYTQSTRKGRRADAKMAVLDVAARQERYLSTNNVYAGTPALLGLPGTAFPINVTNGSQSYYRLTLVLPTTTTFTVTATPINGQALDVCGAYILDQLGRQTNTGTSPATSCW